MADYDSSEYFTIEIPNNNLDFDLKTAPQQHEEYTNVKINHLRYLQSTKQSTGGPAEPTSSSQNPPSLKSSEQSHPPEEDLEEAANNSPEFYNQSQFGMTPFSGFHSQNRHQGGGIQPAASLTGPRL